jgi:hypothetical protein
VSSHTPRPAERVKHDGRLAPSIGLSATLCGPTTGRPSVRLYPLEPGALRLGDLGFFSVPLLQQVVAAWGHLLCRPKARMQGADAEGRWWQLHDLLANCRNQELNMWVSVGTTAYMVARLYLQIELLFKLVSPSPEGTFKLIPMRTPPRPRLANGPLTANWYSSLT